jgi:simple sugar transport system ATP-binding protein
MKLELRGITKRFGAFTANDKIDLTVEAGEIHALLGENGAGKSTLMNVLYGLYLPEEGEILLDGKVQNFQGPGDAMRAGIGMVHQHFMLIPVFTVAENLILGHEPTKGAGILDLAAARQRVTEISERFGFHIDPDSVVEDLSVGQQQRVEIIKALSQEAKVLVLDEPTAVLTPQETDELMRIMDELRKEGKSIVFISHKLREVRHVSDRITVIRRGKVVGTAEPTASNEELAALMVGHDVSLTVKKDAPKLGKASFAVRDLTVFGESGQRFVDNLSFEINEGEILVVAGVQGNGQTELTEAIIGLQPKTAGSIELNGKELLGLSVKQALDSGVGFVPEDRTVDGIVGDFTIAENLVLDMFDRAPFSRGIALDLAAIHENAETKVEQFDVRTPSTETAVGRLSGGNQQKVVLSKWMQTDPDVLILDEPTRGIDVGAKYEIYKLIHAMADEGKAVIVISSELPELLGISDRIYTIREGEITGELAAAEADQETLMRRMTTTSTAPADPASLS